MSFVENKNNKIKQILTPTKSNKKYTDAEIFDKVEIMHNKNKSLIEKKNSKIISPTKNSKTKIVSDKKAVTNFLNVYNRNML